MFLRASLFAVLLTASLTSCSDKQPAAPPAKGKEVASEPIAKVEDSKASPQTNKPKFPPEARRNSPPEGIVANAVAEGSAAPAFTLPGPSGDVSLVDVLSKTTHVVLVFYRGAW